MSEIACIALRVLLMLPIEDDASVAAQRTLSRLAKRQSLHRLHHITLFSPSPAACRSDADVGMLRNTHSDTLASPSDYTQYCVRIDDLTTLSDDIEGLEPAGRALTAVLPIARVETTSCVALCP